jgi:AcrR family transcriptional regulator
MNKPIPARILRAQVDDRFGRPPQSAKEIARDQRIVTEARYLLVRNGRPAFTMVNLALALRMSPATIRLAFCDLDNIVFEIIRLHLAAIETAIAALPADTQDLARARRAVYLGMARTESGALSEAHCLLVRERHALPADLTERLDALRGRIGAALGGAHAGMVLAVLDTPDTDPQLIEAMLAPLNIATPATPRPTPSPPPPAPVPATLAQRLGLAFGGPPQSTRDALNTSASLPALAPLTG